MSLKRNTPLKPGKRIKPSNAQRRKKTFDRNFGERGAAVREMECLCARELRDYDGDCEAEHAPRACSGAIQACHTVARGMGGAKGTKRDLVPLCSRHHTEMGERGTSSREEFEARYGLAAQDEAERIAIELDGLGLS